MNEGTSGGESAIVFDAISAGDVYEIETTVTAEDVRRFGELSGDDNAIHTDEEFARAAGYRDRLAYGGLVMAYLSRLLGHRFPGTGAIWLSQQLRFQQPLYVGDRIAVRARVTRRSVGLRTLTLAIDIRKHPDETALTGEIEVQAQPSHVSRPSIGPIAEGTTLVSVAAPESRRAPSQRVAVVTGGAGGIGSAIAETLAADGVSVVVGYRSSERDAEATVERIHRAGGRAVSVRADVTVPKDLEALCQRGVQAFGDITIVVNNAGPSLIKRSVFDTTADDLRNSFGDYVTSAFELVRLTADGMRAAGFGRIISIVSSAVVGAAPPGLAAYVAAKGALLSLARVWAAELGPFGITSNAVSPSLVNTRLRADLSDPLLRAAALRNPSGRLTTTRDVANAVAFLASPGAGQLNGVHLTVSGGESVI